ncbi:hypothetical protein SNE40_007097 [Patella caerulea]
MYCSVKFIALTFVLFAVRVKGHGRLIDPPSRASMWRYGFDLPQSDYDDNQGYCGGQQQLWNRFKGVCGVCGDARSPIPRAHERGGKYYAGTVVKTYQEGDSIEVTTQITANHRGWYEFRLCAYDNPRGEDLEHDTNGNFVEVSHECLNKHLLQVEDGGTRWYLPAPYKVGLYTVRVKLPEGLSCHNCLFQWKWNVANSWGSDPGGESCIGCGEQEQFYACSDISIEPRSGKIPPGTWTPPQLPPRQPQVPPKRPLPEKPKYRPQTHRPYTPAPIPHRPTRPPIFTYSPIFPKYTLPNFIPKQTPQSNLPSWIPSFSTKQPTWYWYNHKTEADRTPERGTPASVGTSNTGTSTNIGTSLTFDKSSFRTNAPTDPQTPAKPTVTHTNKKASSVRFWSWLANRFSPKAQPTESPIPTTTPADSPWWVKLPTSKKVIQWWHIISKFHNRISGTTTAVPLPWWVKNAKSSQELLPKFFNEKSKDIEKDKAINGISSAASKDAPAVSINQPSLRTERIGQPMPVQITKTTKITKRKRICTPVGKLIQYPNMWLWCDVNCSNRHCPTTHCLCSG